MVDILYHLRRMLASWSFEAAMQLLAWSVGVRGPSRLLLWVGLVCVVAGAAFLLAPASMAGVFDFQQLSAVALGDIRAYYGSFLLALGLVLVALAGQPEGRRAGLWVVIALAWGSAVGRLVGFAHGVPLWSVHGLLSPVELWLGWHAWCALRTPPRPVRPAPIPPLNPVRPEDFHPLAAHNFSDPYPYYRLLRDQFPVYQLPGTDFFNISRYEDIVALARDTEGFSSHLTEILVTGRPRDPARTGPTVAERLGLWGVLPADVLALQDPPLHGHERKIAHSGFNAHFVKALEPEVAALCDEMMDEFLAKGRVEFIQDFAWRLPMRLIIRLLGLPEQDYPQIKHWCEIGIRQLSGVVRGAESLRAGCASAQFMRYLWRHYRAAQRAPADNFTGLLVRQAKDPQSVMSDARAVSIMLQLLIAGSDSSASSMGNAIRMLALHPEIEQRLRREPERIPDFIEEVFRTEAAFQGHFRLSTRETVLHGVKIPANSRVFLMWASGNRDERFWERPDTFDIDRPNLKKHLTFGHGVHACIGRELARMEIRIVIGRLLARTSRFAIRGETPFEASMFARTLKALPLAFEIVPDGGYNEPSSCSEKHASCPSQQSAPCPLNC